LVDKLILCANHPPSSLELEEGKQDETTDAQAPKEDEEMVNTLRRDLSKLPRLVHRSLDKGDVHAAATYLLQLFTIIVGGGSNDDSSSKSEFQLALALSTSFASKGKSTALAQKQQRLNIKYTYQSHPLLQTQAKMIYLHSQTIPTRIVKMAKKLLLKPASFDLPTLYLPEKLSKSEEASNYGAFLSASALSALDMLDIQSSITTATNQSHDSIRAVNLIDLYYESKAKLIHKLLNQLSSVDASSSSSGGNEDGTSTTLGEAEMIVTRIVLILQYDVILHPYQIFVLRQFPTPSGVGGRNEDNQKTASDYLMSTLPSFDADVLKSKSSHFLAAHLPLIRSKVKTVLNTIAGTTASRLGHVRQILYDRTDGADCKVLLDSNGVCMWEEAVGGMVDVRVVSHGTSFSAPQQQQETLDGNNNAAAAPTTTKKFSLWSALFSSAFSSLVHSLLTTSFHSVHSRIISALRASLANAPPLHRILPHEAHRNALRIATELDLALKKVSDDAHELLVHAEEREESEQRLRQSLYVQTCEIMGRLLSELRRILAVSRNESEMNDKYLSNADATKELIVGRLCHLLKFRLTSLPKLLDPDSSPSALAAINKLSSASSSSYSAVGGSGTTAGAGKSGMITLMELQSSFDLADDDDDGLISFEEAMEAMESAFSGTPFRGAEMVRDTLLLSSSSSSTTAASTKDREDEGDLDDDNEPSSSTSGRGGGVSSGIGPRNVTLSELALLSARGLRHDTTGPYSARGTVQRALDDIVSSCFKIWGKVALYSHLELFKISLKEFVQTAASVSSLEWERQCGLFKGDEEKGEHELLMDEIGDAMMDDDDALGDNGEGVKKKKELKVGGVSSYITSYLLSASSVLNRSVCPSDSLPPVPSSEYALSLGVTVPTEKEGGFESIPNMMHTLRSAVLGEALCSLCEVLEECLLLHSKNKRVDEDEERDEEEEDLAAVSTATEVLPSLEKFNVSSLVQLLLDVTFVRRCFFERNHHGFVVDAADSAMDALLSEFGGGELDDIVDEDCEDIMEQASNFVDKSKGILEKLVDTVSTHLASSDSGNNEEDSEMVAIDVPPLMDGPMRERHMEVYTSCDLFLSSLFGEDSSVSSPSAATSLYGMGIPSSSATLSNSAAASLILNPLPSSRRFVLLPIQAERSLNELQLRGKYRKDRSEKAGNKEEAPVSGGAVSAGFGFFSNMLGKK